MQFRKKDIFTIPNILTYIRILLVPVFVVVYINSRTWTDHAWAIAIVVLSALTDVIDGIIARKYNLVTDLGKIIDPIADKAMEFAMLICVIFKYRLVWILLVIFALKEIISVIFSTYLLKRGKHIDGANWAGKLCTVVLYGVMLAFIIFPELPKKTEKILVIASAIFMFLAFAVYMSQYVKLLVELKKEQREQKQLEQK